MKVLTDEMVVALATELKALGIEMETTSGIVHTLDTEEQAQELLEYLSEEQITDKQVILMKLTDILGYLDDTRDVHKSKKNQDEKGNLEYKDYVKSDKHIFFYNNYSETEFKVTKIMSIENDYNNIIKEIYKKVRLSDQIVRAIAIQMKSLRIDKETTLKVIHLLDTEEQAQELLEYLIAEQPTDDQVIYKKIKIIIGLV